MRLIIIFISAVTLLQGPVLTGAGLTEINFLEAQTILENLYQALGDKRIECPELEISSSEEYVAKYSPGSHKIVLEQKTIDLCNTFGDHRDDALAFIIGHELAHAFQGHLDHSDETSFLAYNKVYSPDLKRKVDVKLKESEADVFGSFGAYLAGYEIQKVFPELINSIYSSYGLTDKILPQYPTKSFRNKTAKNMMSKLDSLVKTYELGNYLSLTGHYTEASACYNYVGTSYKGIELVNNQGVNNLLEALNLSKLNAESYYYPIELDLNSRLHKAKKTADTKDLNPSEKMFFNLLIIDAIQKFKEAISMDNNYLPAHINIVCTHAINNQPKKGLTFIEESNLENKIYKQGNADLRASYEIAKAICLIKSGNESKGTMLLKALKSTSNENIAELAKINLNGGITNSAISESGSSNNTTKLFNKHKLTKPSKVKSQFLDSEKNISLTYWSKSKKLFYNLKSENQELLIVSSSSKSSIDIDSNPFFINRELSVYKDHGVAKIDFENDSKEIIVLRK